MKDINSRIGLITFISNNYGTLLQAYAIKKALEEISGTQITFYNFKRKFYNSNVSSKDKIRRICCYSLKELLYYRKFKTIVSKQNQRFDEFKELIYSDNLDGFKAGLII